MRTFNLSCGHSYSITGLKSGYLTGGFWLHCKVCKAAATILSIKHTSETPVSDTPVNDCIVDMVFDVVSSHPKVHDFGQHVDKVRNRIKTQFREALRNGGSYSSIPSPALPPSATINELVDLEELRRIAKERFDRNVELHRQIMDLKETLQLREKMITEQNARIASDDVSAVSTANKLVEREALIHDLRSDLTATARIVTRSRERANHAYARITAIIEEGLVSPQVVSRLISIRDGMV